MDLHQTRNWSDGCPQGLTFMEIAAFKSLTGTRLSPDDITLIQGMDAAFLKAFTEQTKANRERQKEEQKGKG